jgi:hypothetical protein
VATGTKRTVALSIFVPIATLAYPILDTLVAIVRRHLRGRPFWSADRQHIHHRLISRGLTVGGAAVVIYLLSLVCGVVAVALVLESDVAVVIGVLTAVGTLLVGARRLGLHELVARVPPEERRRLKRLHAFVEFALLKVEAEPLVAAALLDQAAREVGGRIVRAEPGRAPPAGDALLVTPRSSIFCELEGGPVFREEALAQLARLAWRAGEEPAAAGSSSSSPPPAPTSDDDGGHAHPAVPEALIAQREPIEG